MKNVLLGILCLWTIAIIPSHEIEVFKKALNNNQACEAYCQKYGNNPDTYHFDVDQSDDAFFTLGSYIDMKIFNPEINVSSDAPMNPHATRKRALKLAELVQKKRTHKTDILKTLFLLWIHDDSAFDDLQAWFLKNPVNVDTVVLNTEGLTCGFIVDALQGGVDREKARKVADVFKSYRSQNAPPVGSFGGQGQYNADECNNIEFWRKQLVRYVAPVCVEDLSDDELDNVPVSLSPINEDNVDNAHVEPQRQVPNPASTAPWLTPQRIGILLILVGGALYYYWASSSGEPDSDQCGQEAVHRY